MSLGVTVTNEEAIVRHTKRTNYWIQLGKQCRKGKKKGIRLAKYKIFSLNSMLVPVSFHDGINMHLEPFSRSVQRFHIFILRGFGTKIGDFMTRFQWKRISPRKLLAEI